MTSGKGFLIESKILSAFIKSDENSIKEIVLIKKNEGLKEKLKKESVTLDNFPLNEVLGAFEEYLAGKSVKFEFKCDLTGYTDLEKKILMLVKGVAYGKTISYEEIAIKAGNKNLRRAVGRTVKKNRFPIVIPCHRVIGKAGGMTGYSADGGIELKKELLALEKTKKDTK